MVDKLDGIDEMEDNFYAELEKQWRKSIPKYTEADIIESTFSSEAEAHEFFDTVIREKKENIERDESWVIRWLENIETFDKTKLAEVWNSHKWIDAKNFQVTALMESDRFKSIQLEKQHINRLKRNKSIASVIFNPNKFGDKIGKLLDIETARNASIFSIISHVAEIKKGKSCCVFHDDKTPSMKVYENTNSFFCFGCGVGGDSIDFVMKYYNVGFVDAVQKILGGGV